MGIVNRIDKNESNYYIKTAADNEEEMSPLLYSLLLLKSNNHTYENKKIIEMYLKKSADKGNPGSMYIFIWMDVI